MPPGPSQFEADLGLQPDPNKTLASFESFLHASCNDNLSVVLSNEEFDRPEVDRERLLHFSERDGIRS